MGDNLKPDDRKKTMRAVKGKGTGLEKTIFAMLAGMRLGGWHKNSAAVTGKPDVVFLDQKVAIFVDGCFWHGCPHCQRKMPKTNAEYWEHKVFRNVERAELYNQKLNGDGWIVVRIWEHEIVDREERAGIRAKIREAISRGMSNDGLRVNQTDESPSP